MNGFLNAAKSDSVNCPVAQLGKRKTKLGKDVLVTGALSGEIYTLASSGRAVFGVMHVMARQTRHQTQ